jgi:hypothetical protein
MNAENKFTPPKGFSFNSNNKNIGENTSSNTDDSDQNYIKLFKKIDKLLFEFITTLKSNPLYLKSTDFLKSINHEKRIYLNQFVTFIFVIAPLIIIFGLFSINQKIKKSLQLKQDIIKDINSNISELSNIAKLKQELLISPLMKSQSDLDSKVRNGFNRGSDQAPLANITTSDFKMENPISEISNLFVSKGKINFSKLSNKQLMDFLVHVTSQDKMHINELSIIKEIPEITLKGTIEVQSLGEETNFADSFE